VRIALSALAAPAHMGLPALRRSFSAFLPRMFDDRVRTGEHQAGVTVIETHQVGRLSVRSTDFDDLARPLRLAHDVAPHAEPVPDGRPHQPTSSSVLATRAPKDIFTACHITMVSIHRDADGRYWPCGGTARQAAEERAGSR